MERYKYEAGGIIQDTETGLTYHTDDIVELLNEKDQRIAELEDKDWYEGVISQLEEQNGRLIRQRDMYKLQLEEKWKRKTRRPNINNQLAIKELQTARNILNKYLLLFDDIFDCHVIINEQIRKYETNEDNYEGGDSL
ncbi:MAG: hypothetical protein J6J36_07070 [Clostridia bacterium]|nr:hypothetical protein [Clostridia bacterium]